MSDPREQGERDEHRNRAALLETELQSALEDLGEQDIQDAKRLSLETEVERLTRLTNELQQAASAETRETGTQTVDPWPPAPKPFVPTRYDSAANYDVLFGSAPLPSNAPSTSTLNSPAPAPSLFSQIRGAAPSPSLFQGLSGDFKFSSPSFQKFGEKGKVEEKEEKEEEQVSEEGEVEEVKEEKEEREEEVKAEEGEAAKKKKKNKKKMKKGKGK